MRKAAWGLVALTVLIAVMVAGRGTTSADALAQVNTAPVLNAIAPFTIVRVNLGLDGGTSRTIFASSDELDQTLTFTLSGLPDPTQLLVTIADNGDGTALLDVTGYVNGLYTFTVTVIDDGVPAASDLQLVNVTVVEPTMTATPTITLTPTITPSITATITPTPSPTITFTPTLIPTLGFPTATLIPSPTFIPALPTPTPLPRPQNAGQAIPFNTARVRFVVNRDGVNVRITPAIGAPLAGIVNSGYNDFAEARSGDGEWLRFNFEGNDAWVGFPVITVYEGDIASLPVEDPRTIPYGGFDNPRAGLSSVQSDNKGRLEFSGLRVRGGPGLGYPVLANAPRYSVFSLLGRNEEGTWVQVNFEGTLGWVASQYVQFLTVGGVPALPVGGIVADALPFSDRTFNSYTDTLSLFLSRIEIATASLEGIRARWTALALGGALQCGDYPFQPTDYNVPNPVLAAFYGTLDPIQRDFNAAMGNLRRAIQLLIDSCEGRRDPASTVQEALDLINGVDSLFASLRQQLNDLIPPPLEFDPNTACLFTFNNRSTVVPRLILNTVASIRFTSDFFVDGFCFDGGIGRSYKIEVLAFRGNARPRVSVSPFDNPTNFLAVGSASVDNTLVTLSPILIPVDGRYLLILSDLESRQVPLNSEIAILLTDVTGIPFSVANLGIDPVTGALIVAPVPNSSGVPQAGVTTGGGTTGNLSTPGAFNVFTCPNITFTCEQIASVGGTCDTARACFQAGNTSLDNNNDGIACNPGLCGG